MPHSATDTPVSIPLWARSLDGLAFADVPTVAGGRAPDFCLIGGAKCATTSIDAILSKHHPGVFMNPLNEPQYYSTEQQYARGSDWYFGLYADAQPGQVLGEASTSYSRYPKASAVPERIAKDNPDAKILFCVREPVGRLKSECVQEIKYRTYALREDIDVPSLDAYLDQTEADPAERTAKLEAGEYMRQIERFLEFFPKENIKIVLYEDFRKTPDDFLREITDFIGVAPLPPNTNEFQNTATGVVDGITAGKHAAKLSKLPFGNALKRALPKGLRQAARRVITQREAARYEFTAERIAQLRAHYKPHNDALRAWSGKALDGWD